MPTRLTDLLAAQVSRNCRARGYEYFASGAVRDIHLADGAIVARVVGSEEYAVRLAHAGNELRAGMRVWPGTVLADGSVRFSSDVRN